MEGEGEREPMEVEGEGEREPMEGEGEPEPMEMEGEGQREPMEREGEPDEIDSERVNGRDIPDTHGGRVQWLVVIICVVIVCVISGLVGFLAGRLLIRSYFNYGAHTQLLQWLVIGIGLPMTFLPILDPHNRSLAVTISYIIVCGLLGLASITISPLSFFLCVISFVYSAVFASPLFGHEIKISNLSSFIFRLVTLVGPGNWSSDENQGGVSRGHFISGLVFTILGCAIAGLVLPLVYLAFHEVTGEDSLLIYFIPLSFAMVVANTVSIAGLLINGDFGYLMSAPGEPEYWVIFICNGLGWQFLFFVIVGLVYLVASLFSNEM